MKRLAILGSTGIIGRQTLAAARASPDRFQVVGLAAGSNFDLLLQQVEEFHPRFLHYLPSQTRREVKLTDMEYLIPEEMVRESLVDLVVVATGGLAALAPTLTAIRARKPVVLANTEITVAAGELLAEEAQRHGVDLLTVESETAALGQCIGGEQTKPSRAVITACWGPFRAAALVQLPVITPADTLGYPGRPLSRRRSVDAAILMNKGFQVIATHHLFGLPYESIDVLVHPQDVVRTLVEFPDGFVKGVLASPDPYLWLYAALSYAERRSSPYVPRLDLLSVKELTFEPLDRSRFPCFDLAIKAGKRGGTYPAVLNAADETAISLFLSRQLGFPDIPGVINAALERHSPVNKPSVEDVLAADAWAREFTGNQVQR